MIKRSGTARATSSIIISGQKDAEGSIYVSVLETSMARECIKHSRNGIFVKPNTKRFTEFTNCNLSRKLV